MFILLPQLEHGRTFCLKLSIATTATQEDFYNFPIIWLSASNVYRNSVILFTYLLIVMVQRIGN